MDWGNYLFSFNGRTNRAKYWLFVLVAIGVALVCAALYFLLGSVGVIIAVILYLALLYSGLAVGAKRLHDRDKSAWWLLVFYLVPGILSGVGQALESSSVALILSLASLAISIWAFVELGCLRGTEGANQYGPDPLAGRT
jgi:uncharacterized membrane protein YhaH (DUF805 family)